MKARMILVSLGLVTLTILSFGLQAQEGTKGTPQASKDDILTNEQQLARQFADFQDLLLRLKQKMARGTPEERKRAEVLDKVLEECKNLAINQEFNKMIEILRVSRLTTTVDFERVKNQSDKLADDLARILALIQDKGVDVSKERRDLEKLIKDLTKVIDREKTIQGQIDLNKTDAKELAKDSDKVAKDTAKIEKDINKLLDKDGKGGEAKQAKGENKDGGKGEGKKGEAKDAGKPGENKKGETKDAGKDPQGKKGETKPGEPKANDKSPDAEPKSGSKSGEKSPDAQPAGAKGSKSGDPMKDGPQGAAKDNKGGEKSPSDAKDAGKPGDPKKDAGRRQGRRQEAGRRSERSRRSRQLRQARPKGCARRQAGRRQGQQVGGQEQ